MMRQRWSGGMTDEKLKHSWLALVVLIAICFSVAGLGSIATTPSIPNWYAGLAKPSWTPPGWLFGPVWSVLYLSMAVAAWLVWRQGNALVPMILFVVQLAFNAAWSWLFFGMHNPGAALIDIVLLWAAIAATTIAAFWRRSLVAGLLFVPYLAWVSFAAVLNFAIWRLNG
jgi:tryptophan-rich sensory protein